MKRKREKTTLDRVYDNIWLIIAMICTAIYLYWRIRYTLPSPKIYGYFSMFLGIFLVIAEICSMLEGTEHLIRMSGKDMPDMPVIPDSWYPDIDVFIATHNEETELLYKTVNGCKNMDYPDKSKVHIFICDDNNRQEVAELAQRMGVGYFGLANNKHAKAGNLNNAIFKTSSPWIITFDADMIPTSRFLMEAVPYVFVPYMKKDEEGRWLPRTDSEIDPDFKIGFIQTPQSFYNPDLFQFNLYSEKRITNEQDYFFREINMARNSANAPIYAGSNTIISRVALEEVGGIATGTITEDFETGINIQSKGYSCFAVDKTLAHGLAPTEVSSLITQRVRWGRGCISSLRKIKLLSRKDLSLNTKLSYFAFQMYWWSFLRRLVYILTPILYVLFGIPAVISDLNGLLYVWLPTYMLHTYALIRVSGDIRNNRWSNIIDTIMFPYMIVPILMETFYMEMKKFHVTKKTREAVSNSDTEYAMPHIILLSADVLALVVAIREAWINQSYGSIIIIYWLLVSACNLTIAIFFMLGRSNRRVNDRFSIQIAAVVKYLSKEYAAVTKNLSETGLSLRMDKPVYLPYGDDRMEVLLSSEKYSAKVEARVVRVLKREDHWEYGIEITDLSDEDKSNYYHILYDRGHEFARTIDKKEGIVDDIFVNIWNRMSRATEERTLLPRIAVHRNFKTLDGSDIYVKEFCYEKIKLSGEALPRNISIRIEDSDYYMDCERMEDSKSCYKINNCRELISKAAFDIML